MPKTRASSWQQKFEQNVARDRRNLADLADLGWDTIVVWECETGDLNALTSRLALFIDDVRS